MNKYATLLLSTLLLLFAACRSDGGEQNGTSTTPAGNDNAANTNVQPTHPDNMYFIEWAGTTYSDKRCNFGGDFKNGTANFTIAGCRIRFQEGWDKVKTEGVKWYEGKTIHCQMEPKIGGERIEGSAKVDEVAEAGKESVGTRWSLKGVFTAADGKTGRFMVSAFVTER